MKDDITGLDRLDLTRNDLTDGIIDMLRLIHTSLDDNPTAGDGIGMTWRLEESTNNSVFEAASLDILSTDIASGAEDIDWRLSTMIAGTLTEFLHVDADGGFIVEISPLIVRSADPTTEIMIDNTAVDGDPYLSWALSGVRQFTLGVDDGDGDILKLGTTAIGTGTMLEVDTEIRIVDDINLAFGDDSDFTIVYDAAGDARLEIDPSAPDGVIAIGANNVADIIITGDASTLTWDADGDTDGELIMDGGRIRINDDDTLVFGDSAEASFEYDEDGTNHLRYDGVDMVFDTATQLLFRDDAIHINSSVDGQMDVDADVEVEITSPTFHVVASTEVDFDSDVFSFGTGAAATDVVLNFIGETSSGVLTWMEDEDYFEYTDDILVAITENVYFRDTAIHINSSVDGQLDIDADGEVEITSPIVQIVASNQLDVDTNTFNLGAGGEVDIAMNFIAASNNGLFTWMEDEDYFEFADEILMSTTEAIYFRDTALLINSSVDGQLDIDADTEIEITAPTVQIAAATALDVDSDAIYFGTGGAGADVVFTVVGETNTGVFTWMEDENYFEYSNEILMTVGSNIYFRDVAIHISSSTDGQMDIDADGEVEITTVTLDVNSDAIQFGTNAEADIVMSFDAASNDGEFKWMEDEDYFEYTDDILIAVAENIYFRDVAIHINSSVDGQLDIDADDEVEITSPIVQIVASNQLDVDTNTFNFGTGADVDVAVNFIANTNSGLFTWMEDEDYFEFADDILLSTTEQLYFRDTDLTIFSSTDGQLDIDADVEIELTAPTIDIAGLLTLTVDDANNVTVTDVLTITHTTTGVAGPGIGTGLSFSVEDLGGAQQQGSIDVVMTDVTNLTEDSDMAFSVIVNGTITEMMRLNADGGIEIGWNTDTDVPLTFMATTNDGVLTWMEDEDYFEYSDDILMNTTENVYFRDVAIHINSSVDGQLDIDADGEVEITSPIVHIVAATQLDVDTNTFNLGAGGEVDIAVNFIAASNSGLFTWMEDEDYFEFADEILMSTTEQIYFRDTALTIYSSVDGQLDIDADVEVEITTVTLDINSDAIQFGTNAEADIVMSFDAATNDGEFKWMEDEDYFEFTDDILVAVAENIYFRDVDIHINSSVDGQLDIDADGEVEITSPIVQIVASTQLDVDTNTFNLGAGADVDIAMNFIATTNSGLFTWMEDEDYFEFADEILMSTTEQIYFRDTALTIFSSVDGQLDIQADTEVEITATTIDLIGNVDISAGLDVTGAITVTTTVDGVDIAGFNAVQFVAIALDGNVANERVLTAGDGIDLTDGGAGGNVTLAVDVTDILGNGLGETANDIFVYELRSSDDGEAALTADADGRLVRPDCEFATKYEWTEDFDDEAAGVQFEAGMVADFWTTAGTNYAAGNVTYQEDAGGTTDALTAGADDDSVTALGLFNWRVDANPIIEARFKVLDITNAFICAGFVEGAFADKAAYDDDIAVVGIDTDNAHGFGAGQIIFVTNDTNAGAVVQDCGVAITLDTFITIRIDLTDTEQPRVWVNNTGGAITAANEVAAGSITGTVQAGISVAPYFMVQSLSAAADTFTIDYIKCWQDRA